MCFGCNNQRLVLNSAGTGSTSTGFASNQYLPVKHFGFSGSYFHAGAISARTYMTYSLEFNLFVLTIVGILDVWVNFRRLPRGVKVTVQDSTDRS